MGFALNRAGGHHRGRLRPQRRIVEQGLGGGDPTGPVAGDDGQIDAGKPIGAGHAPGRQALDPPRSGGGAGRLDGALQGEVGPGAMLGFEGRQPTTAGHPGARGSVLDGPGPSTCLIDQKLGATLRLEGLFRPTLVKGRDDQLGATGGDVFDGDHGQPVAQVSGVHGGQVDHGLSRGFNGPVPDGFLELRGQTPFVVFDERRRGRGRRGWSRGGAKTHGAPR